MTEWSEDPMEVRANAIYHAVTLSKRGRSIQQVIEDARHIERFIKAAKPRAKKLKLYSQNNKGKL